MNIRACILFCFFAFILHGVVSADVYEVDAEAYVTKTKLYPNEIAILRNTLYTTIDCRYEGFETEPRMPYFWTEVFELDQGRVETQMVQWRGKKAIRADVRKAAFFPMRPGHYAIHPGKINVTKGDPKKDSRGRPMFLVYKPINIEVIDFPQADKPADFNGFSGVFSLSSKAEVVWDKLHNGEYVVLTLKISGEGNIRQVGMPKLDLPAGFILFEVSSDVVVENKRDMISGMRTFQLKIKPLQKGVFKIPAAHFSYFNVYTQKYMTTEANEHEVSIAVPPIGGPPVTKSNKNKVVIALDTSGSMLSRDFDPDDRITFAKRLLTEILSNALLEETVSGMLSFAKKTNKIWPLTQKPDYVNLLGPIYAVTSTAYDGTAIGNAIYEAAEMLDAYGETAGEKIVLLITDGTANSGYIDPLTAAYLSADKKIKIYTIGVGKGGKVKYPIIDKDFGDRETELEMKVDRTVLEEISQITGGKTYFIKSEDDFKMVASELIQKLSF